MRWAAVALAIGCAACGPATLEGPSKSSAPSSDSCEAVQTTPDEGNAHIEAGKTVAYPTFPPSSGPHDPRPLQAGIYEQGLSRRPSGAPASTIFRAVHSLEHGYVIVFVRDASDVEKLRQLAGVHKVIVTPAPELGAKMALVAWRRVQLCDAIDVVAAQAFIQQYRERTAPEPSAP
jgi:hypothetical protein